ncbi:MAG TPA: YidB family protein [Ramlibacter sp.]|nr:YidB family protein [Ramlibacter sp.]
MANPFLKLVLGSLFAGAMRGRARTGPFGAGAGGTAGRAGGGRGMLLAMLLPFALQWVQRNGGIGAVLERFKQKGYGPQAKSWMSTGENEPLDTDAIDNVIGREELSRLARQLGVPEQEVATGFAEILPEVVDQLSPEGELPPEADEALDAGLSELEKELSHLTTSAPA